MVSESMPALLRPPVAIHSSLMALVLRTIVSLASVLASVGRFLDAAAEFERLAELDPDRAGSHQRKADGLRARLN